MADFRYLRTPAARLEVLLDLFAPQPIYCECGCDCIVGHGDPLIDSETFLRMLDEPVSTPAIPNGDDG